MDLNIRNRTGASDPAPREGLESDKQS